VSACSVGDSFPSLLAVRLLPESVLRVDSSTRTQQCSGIAVRDVRCHILIVMLSIHFVFNLVMLVSSL